MDCSVNDPNAIQHMQGQLVTQYHVLDRIRIVDNYLNTTNHSALRVGYERKVAFYETVATSDSVRAQYFVLEAMSNVGRYYLNVDGEFLIDSFVTKGKKQRHDNYAYRHMRANYDDDDKLSYSDFRAHVDKKYPKCNRVVEFKVAFKTARTSSQSSGVILQEPWRDPNSDDFVDCLE